MKRIHFLFFILFSLVLSIEAVIGQTEKELLSNLAEEERAGIEALVMYPEATRLSILEVAKYPALLVKIGNLQKETSEAFQSLLENYDPEIQKEVWDLTRYPGLVSRIAATGPDDNMGLQKILSDYPEVIHQRAKKLYRNHFDLLHGIEALNKQSKAAYITLLKPYPLAVRDAMEQLVELPEVLTILTGHIELAILAGEVYKTDPAWVLKKADSLNLVLARQNASEIEDWKAGLKEDPQTMNELEASAREFAEDYGYDDIYYDSEQYDDLFYDEDYDQEARVVEHHYYYNYPYWFGYPYWYVYPRWRPFPWWYDWGFGYHTGSISVIVRLPAFYIVDWYFYQPFHHYYYPRLTSRFVSHYYGHRHTGSSISNVVDRWKYDNRAVVSDQWLSDNTQRVDRIREFGRMEMERTKYNQRNPDRQLTQRDYINRYQNKFPRVRPTETGMEQGPTPRSRQIEESPPAKKPAPGVNREVPRTKVPPKTIPGRTSEPTPPPRVTREAPRTKEPVKTESAPAPAKTPRTVPREKINTIRKVDRAKDYHRENWDKNPPAKASPKQTAPRKVSPQKPKTTPRKTTDKARKNN